MGVSSREDRPQKKTLLLVVINPEWYIQVYVSLVSAVWGDFSAVGMMWLLPVLGERTSVVLRASGSKRQILLFPWRSI